MAQVRPYRGIDAADRLAERRSRLLAAGLDLLGADPAVADKAPIDLTVRAVCGAAGVSARYFYESFADKDVFVSAVYDWVIAELAATTEAAVAAAPIAEQSRAAMANIVRVIADDARVGRLLFSAELANPTLARKRVGSSTLFATLLFQHAGTLGAADDDFVRAAAHFAVGGVGQTLSTWLSGELGLDQQQLADHLGAMLDAVAAG